MIDAIEHVSNQAATLASIDIGAHNLVNAEANRSSGSQGKPCPWLARPTRSSFHPFTVIQPTVDKIPVDLCLCLIVMQ